METTSAVYTAAEKVLKHIKTHELIEKLAEAEAQENYSFSPAEIVRAFMETNTFPFSCIDIAFIKACKGSAELQALWKNFEDLASDKQVSAAKAELKKYNALKENIKGSFQGLIYYK